MQELGLDHLELDLNDDALIRVRDDDHLRLLQSRRFAQVALKRFSPRPQPKLRVPIGLPLSACHTRHRMIFYNAEDPTKTFH
jgi:hypothetical protein